MGKIHLWKQEFTPITWDPEKIGKNLLKELENIANKDESHQVKEITKNLSYWLTQILSKIEKKVFDNKQAKVKVGSYKQMIDNLKQQLYH